MVRYSGVWPALLTPLTPEDHINVPVTRRLVDYLIRAGISGLYLCGSTGEGVLLPVEERQKMAETVIEQANGRVPVMVHVGAAATADAVTLAAHAERAGAAAVASIPPFYYNVGFQGIQEHYAAIAEASALPFYLYYIPGSTGVTLTAAQMYELCQLPNVQGFKFTAYDLYLLEQILALGKGKLNVFSGPDEMFLPFQALGVDGAIGTTYNFLPGHFVELYGAFQRGDLVTARRLQSEGNRVIDTFIKHGGLPAVKEIMRLIGIDCGYCRRPFRRLSASQVQALRADLEQVGWLSLVAKNDSAH